MRILLADNQSKVRFALRALLEQQPGLTIVGEAAEAGDALLQVEAVHPDLVLLDWDLRGPWNNPHLLVGVLDLLPAMQRVCPELRVIALSARPPWRPEPMRLSARPIRRSVCWKLSRPLLSSGMVSRWYHKLSA